MVRLLTLNLDAVSVTVICFIFRSRKRFSKYHHNNSDNDNSQPFFSFLPTVVYLNKHDLSSVNLSFLSSNERNHHCKFVLWKRIKCCTRWYQFENRTYCVVIFRPTISQNSILSGNLFPKMFLFHQQCANSSIFF